MAFDGVFAAASAAVYAAASVDTCAAASAGCAFIILKDTA